MIITIRYGFVGTLLNIFINLISRYKREIKKPITMKNRLTVLFAISLIAFFASSCNKEEDTILQVRVITLSGAPVAGAEVRAFGQGTVDQEQVGDIRIDQTVYTLGNGIAEFDFSDLYVQGQSGFAILDVEITKEYPDSTSFLTGIVKVVEETTTEKTFSLGSE